MNSILERFSAILEEGRRDDATFSEICGTLGVSPSRFDRYLQDIFGFSGEEIVRAYRFRMPADML